jgi:hypothetical protein
VGFTPNKKHSVSYQLPLLEPRQPAHTRIFLLDIIFTMVVMKELQHRSEAVRPSYLSTPRGFALYLPLREGHIFDVSLLYIDVLPWALERIQMDCTAEM